MSPDLRRQLETAWADLRPPAPAEDERELTPALRGSAAQIRWALNLKPRMIKRFSDEELPVAFLNGACTITDAAWWIANRDRPVHLVRWPEAWRVATQPAREVPVEPEDEPAPRPRRVSGEVLRARMRSTREDLESTRPPEPAWPATPPATEPEPPATRSTPRTPRGAPRTTPEAPEAPQRSHFDADIRPIPDTPGMFALTVHFDARSSGTLRLLREELAVIGRLIRNTLHGE